MTKHPRSGRFTNIPRRKSRYRKRHDLKVVQDNAKSRINELLSFSHEIIDDYPHHAINAIKTARKVAMKVNLSLDKSLKVSFCRKCSIPYNASTLRVRTAKKGQKKVIYTCKKCGYTKRYLM